MTFEHRLKMMREWYFENQLKIPKLMQTVSYAKELCQVYRRLYPEFQEWQIKQLVCARYGCDNWFELIFQLESLQGKK